MENQKPQAQVPATMPEKFRWLKAILRDSELTDGAKIVATALYTFHNQTTGRCDPSQAAIGDATDMHRQAVSVAVRKLRDGEWIRTVSEPGSRLNYILNVDRAAIETGDLSGQKDTLDAMGVSGNPDRGVSAKPDRGCPPSRTGGVRETGHVTTKEPPRETTNLNPVPVKVAIEPEIGGPAKVQTVILDQPETSLPTPANDDVLMEVGEVFHGLLVPADMMRQWLAAFPDTNVRGEVQVLSKWASGLPDKPKGRQFKAIQTRLSKIDAKARQERLSRTENRQAEKVAGVERDFHGRIIGAPKKSRFQW